MGVMRKYLVLMIIVFGFNPIINAKSDGFFKYYFERRDDGEFEWKELVLLPNVHGLDYDYPAENVSIGTGLLLMTGMGLVYAKSRKKK